MTLTNRVLNASAQQEQTTLSPLLSMNSDLNVTCQNQTNQTPSCWPEETPIVMTTTEVTWLATILVVVFLCSAVGNSLVCVVFSQQGGSGGGLSLSNRFLANLTVCNGLFTLLVMPVALTSLLSRQWLFGPVLCQGTGLAVNLLVTASTFTLAVIAMDRYCAVVTPLHYTLRMTQRRCAGFIAAIWAASLAVTFPPLLGWNSFKFHVNKMICTVAWDSSDLADRYYTLFLVTVSFLLPLGAMLWTYGRIFRAARDNSERTRRSSVVPAVQQAEYEACQCTPVSKRRRGSSVPILRRLSQTSSRSGGSLLQKREEWKTAVTSFLILFSFMLCWLPYFLVILLRALTPSLSLHPVLSTISTTTALFACACNPLVYVFRSKATRQHLRLILTRKRSLQSEVFSTIPRGGGGGSVRRESGKGERETGSVLWPQREEEGGERGCDVECQSVQQEGDVPPCGGQECVGSVLQSSVLPLPSVALSQVSIPCLQSC